MSAGPSGYSPLVRSLFATLPRAGDLPVGGTIVAGEAAALDRGAWVRFEARLEGGRIADCRFRAFGCPHTLAAAALAAQMLTEGPTPPDARELAAALEAPPAKMGRLLVVEDAMQALLSAQARLQ